MAGVWFEQTVSVSHLSFFASADSFAFSSFLHPNNKVQRGLGEESWLFVGLLQIMDGRCNSVLFCMLALGLGWGPPPPSRAAA